MKKPRDVIQPRWGVYALRDEKAAIERALTEIELPKRSQFRISVRRGPTCAGVHPAQMPRHRREDGSRPARLALLDQ